MKWRKNKKKQQSFSASSRPFSISQVLPTSWITKFKQMSLNSGEKNAKMKQRGKWNSVPTNSSRFPSDGGKFHGADGDAFWRLSFGEDSLEELKSRAVLRSVRYNSDDDLEFPPSSCQSCRSNATRANGKEYAHKFNDMISRVRKNSGFPKQVAILPQVQTCVREKVAEIRTPRLTVLKEKKLRKANQEMNLREDCKLTAAYSRKECCTSPLNSIDSYTRKIEEEFEFTEIDGISEENFLSEWQKLKEKKVKEVKSRNEEQRKSMYISRELQRKKSKQKSKVRTYSPRTASRAEICKIKALEDMKKAKLKMKRKAKENATEDFQGLESFAVVKCSYDPQKDFRDSMIEMIEEKRISRPEELEELLACYLTLNSDEYHDLIIRIFRQVWLELSQACLDTELENEECH